MMRTGAYDDLAALTVFRHLDPADLAEAQALRGAGVRYPQLFAEWHAVQGAALLSLVINWHGLPVALLMLGHTGQAGVAQAALMGRDHRRFRAAMIATARRVRVEMPIFCRETGIHRIEARAWSGHPRAGIFLKLCGFQSEVQMPGFGSAGAEVFHQYAWTA